MNYFKAFPLRMSAIAGSLLTLSCAAVAQSVNIAQGKPVTTNIESTESYTIDKNPARLTDGKYAGSEYDAQHKASTLWVQDGALTWRVRADLIVMTIDLEKEMPISGVSYSTAAGVAGVQFPSFIGILVSDDAKTWKYQGDLVSLSRKNGLPKLGAYTKFRFTTQELQTKGRYIALAVHQVPYTVVDEIEVYGGNNAWLGAPVKGETLNSLDTPSLNPIAQKVIASGYAFRRVATDIAAISQFLTGSAITAERKATFSQLLEKARRENGLVDIADPNLKTNLPITKTHREVMALYGRILAAKGHAPLTVWKQHRYAWLPLIAEPPAKRTAGIDIGMLKNQFRSDALLVTNATGTDKAVTLQLRNAPAGAGEGWLKIDSAAWTDTFQGIPVADALLPVAKTNGKYSVSIPAGFTGKLWFTVDSSKLPPGDWRSTLLVNDQKIPFHLSVSKTVMARPRMSLTMWDNADHKSLAGSASRGITARNKAAALALMKSHFVDAPWADRPILPWPTAQDFDAQNRLTHALDFSDFDQWIAEWPQARIFFIFISAHEKEGFAGAEFGTPEFNARLGAWAKAFAEHIRARGLRPQQVSLLINDEPGIFGDWQDDVVAEWASAIHSGAPDLNVMSDPTWKRPDLQKNQKAFTEVNLLMPNAQIYLDSPAEVADFFAKRRQAGTDLWLYSCTGPVRLFNPQNYYRGQAWRVFSIGGKGMGFWAFNDIGGAPTAWHDYQIPTSFCPVFLDKDKAYNSIHWDAVREGVEDFEELSMLRDAIAKSSNATLKREAGAVLQETLKAALAPATTASWYDEKNPQMLDQQLRKVRGLLSRFEATGKTVTGKTVTGNTVDIGRDDVEMMTL